MKLLMQCPGCWSVSEGEQPAGGWLECDCGEKLTVIDLRDNGCGKAPITADRGDLDRCVRMVKLDPSEPDRLNIHGRGIYVPESSGEAEQLTKVVEDGIRQTAEEAAQHPVPGETARLPEPHVSLGEDRQGLGARFRDFEKAVRVLFESQQVVDAVAEADAINELYGHWEDFPAREANQRRRYANLAKKPGVQESWKAGARERIATILTAAFASPSPAEEKAEPEKQR